jgi:hypothetical protein
VVCLIQVNGKDFKFPFSRAAAGVKKSQNSERYRKQDAVHESDVLKIWKRTSRLTNAGENNPRE